MKQIGRTPRGWVFLDYTAEDMKKCSRECDPFAPHAFQNQLQLDSSLRNTDQLLWLDEVFDAAIRARRYQELENCGLIMNVASTSSDREGS